MGSANEIDWLERKAVPYSIRFNSSKLIVKYVWERQEGEKDNAGKDLHLTWKSV